MPDHDELLMKTREKAYVTLIKLCEDETASHEIRLQASAMLLQATGIDLYESQQEGASENSDVASIVAQATPPEG